MPPGWKSNPTEATVNGRARPSNAAWVERLDKFEKVHDMAQQDAGNADDDAEEDSDEDGPMPNTFKHVVGCLLLTARELLPNGLGESCSAWQIGFSSCEVSMLPLWTLSSFSQSCFIFPPFAFPH